MIGRATTAWLCAILFAFFAPPAGAQIFPLTENFESGLPPNWHVSGTAPMLWHIAPHGQCGASTNMAAFNSAACSYSDGGHAPSGILESSAFSLVGNGPFNLSFRYLLELDVDDSVEVLLVDAFSGATMVSLAETVDFMNDGALHDALFQAPDELHWITFKLQFKFRANALGNHGKGWLVDNVVLCEGPVGITFCFGTANACPCGNSGGVQEGCANSTGHGATLAAIGSTSVSLDTLLFVGTGIVPGKPALLFQGLTAQNGGHGVLLGDGLLCAGGTLRRLGVTFSDAVGGAMWGPDLANMGGWNAGMTVRFQDWYRDPVGSPCAHDFNLSNGVEITFTP